MRTNSVSAVNFQATIPPKLKEKLMTEARRIGQEKAFDYLAHMKKVESWGEFATEISEISSPQLSETYLGLVNHLIKPLRQSLLPNKSSLLESFMALTEKDIVNAENKLSKLV